MTGPVNVGGPGVCPAPADHATLHDGSEITVWRKARRAYTPPPAGECGHCGGRLPEAGQVAA